MAGKIPSTSASDDSSRHRFRSDPMIPRDRPDSVRELKETLLHSKVWRPAAARTDPDLDTILTLAGA